MMTQETLPTCVALLPLVVNRSNGNGKLQDFYDRDLYDKVIKPEVEKAGFEPWSAVEASPDYTVVDQLRSEIADSELVIADIRDNNPNVLYEIGWADAHRKPILLIASDINSVPVDLFDSLTLLYEPSKIEGFRKLLGRHLRRYTHEKV